MSSSQPEGSIHIPSITLNVLPQSGKTVDHIVFKSKTSQGRFEKEVSVQIPPGQEYKELFDPALKLSAQDKLFVGVKYQSWLSLGKTISLGLNEVISKLHDDEDGKQVFSKAYKDFGVTIGISRLDVAASGSFGESSTSREVHHPSTSTAGNETHPSLTSTTSEIFRICPRFRLLIIGNSGVGKSTLIHKVFGVKDVNVSESSRGEADINREFVADENKLFVVHDSVGLEAGESNNFDRVKDFIAKRRKMTELKDRLHAVWVCIAVPYSDGRLLEAGIERFLREKETILGDIPIVVVLTKLDLLDASLLGSLGSKGTVFKSIEEAREIVAPQRSAFLKSCVKPLEALGGNIPQVAVSTRGEFGLEPTISELVKITTSQIEQYIQADPSFAVLSERPSIERNAPLFIAGMAQRASIERNVQTAIDVGKKRYWKNLGTSLAFDGKKVADCLGVIHEDIVRVWNFNDPEFALQDEHFKEALLDTSNLKVQDIRNLKDAMGPVAPMISALVPLAQEFVGFAIALPVAGVAILMTLCHEVYKSTKTIAKRFMAYIVDLMYVMKILFVLAPEGTITIRKVALALGIYEKLTYRNRIHLEIGCFSANWVIFPGGRDMVLTKIEELIGRYNFTDEEVSRVWREMSTGAGSL